MVATPAVGKAWAWELYAMFASIREEAQTIDETEIDAQFELLDALLLGQPIRSFPELSLLPIFRTACCTENRLPTVSGDALVSTETGLHSKNQTPGVSPTQRWS